MSFIRSILFPIRLKCVMINKRYFGSNDIRNIGILAHIDAGKTTTTERMLFYSGKTRSLGEVHRGTTVTDYLSQERERGITICSSAVTFPWRDKKINLLDTPGHIDFTMEVEQSLYAVDGVVVILDGTAGVEAQTVTVWSQSEKHRLPKISFVNKMDRPEADFDKCVQDLAAKLDAKPICLQLPYKDEKGNLSIYDVVNLKHITWNTKSLGRLFESTPITNEKVLLELQDKRSALIDDLSTMDDNLADLIISSEDFNNVTNEMIYKALRKATCQCKIVPVLLGSAYKNVGIQKLMDAVIDFLPNPNERNQFYDCFENDFVGKVFKIVHDKQRGALSLVRVLRGTMNKSMRLTSTRGQSEVVGKLYEPLADEYREITKAEAGDVAISSGLKHTVTGDLLVTSTSSLKHAQKRLQKQTEASASETTESEDIETDLINEIFSVEPQIPDAVYFCSIEPPSVSYQTAMESALKQLQREDPSLRVSYDSVTGQTVLGGMGELHMDIIKSRLLSEYNIEVDLGPLQIAYKETIEDPALTTFSTEKEIAGSKQSITITLELVKDNKEQFSLHKTPETTNNLLNLRPRTLQVIRKGCISALERGPKVGGQVVETQIKLHNVIIGRGTADSFIMSAAGQCVQKILSDNGTRLLEPIMALEIVLPNDRTANILSDLARRRAVINDVVPKGDKNKLILVNAPLAELSNYSSILRKLSSGTASMTMQPCGFSKMLSNDEEQAIRRAQGFE